LDIQKGVSAVFTSGGSLTGTGTLQIEGTVNLSGLTKAFYAVTLTDGSLVGGTFSAGKLTDNGTTASVLSTTLGEGVGSLFKTGAGTLTISGANAAYASSIIATDGTIVMGSPLALGPTARIAALGQTATIRLSGNSLTLVGVAGVGTIENASSSAVTLTLNTDSNATFGGVFRDGTGNGALSLVKDGVTTVTLNGTSTYTGSTTVKQGLLQLTGGQLPANTAVDIQGGTLALGGQSLNVRS
jgi:autotransporter-associated beta strand protein